MGRHRLHRLGRRAPARLGALLSVPVIAVVLAATAPTEAQAAPAPSVADLTCTISGTAHVTPGISLLSQPEKLAGQVQGGTDVSPLTPCTSLSGGPYQGFTMTLTGTGYMACLTAALQGGLTGTGKVSLNPVSRGARRGSRSPISPRPSGGSPNSPG